MCECTSSQPDLAKKQLTAPTRYLLAYAICAGDDAVQPVRLTDSNYSKYIIRGGVQVARVKLADKYEHDYHMIIIIDITSYLCFFTAIESEH